MVHRYEKNVHGPHLIFEVKTIQQQYLLYIHNEKLSKQIIDDKKFGVYQWAGKFYFEKDYMPRPYHFACKMIQDEHRGSEDSSSYMAPTTFEIRYFDDPSRYPM